MTLRRMAPFFVLAVIGSLLLTGCGDDRWPVAQVTPAPQPLEVVLIDHLDPLPIEGPRACIVVVGPQEMDTHRVVQAVSDHLHERGWRKPDVQNIDEPGDRFVHRKGSLVLVSLEEFLTEATPQDACYDSASEARDPHANAVLVNGYLTNQ